MESGFSNVFAFVNPKGGAAKSTTCVCLAGALVQRGRRVLVCDFDDQGSSTSWLGHKEPPDIPLSKSQSRSLREAILEGEPLSAFIRSTACGVDLLPTGRGFKGYESMTTDYPVPQVLLRKALGTLQLSNWDYVFVDTPGTLGVTTTGAMVASGHVLIPVPVGSLNFENLPDILGAFRDVKEHFNPTLALSGFVVSRVDERTSLGQQYNAALRKRYPKFTYSTFIHENVAVGECHAKQRPVTQYDGRSTGAKDFRALAVEFEAKHQDAVNTEDKETIHG